MVTISWLPLEIQSFILEFLPPKDLRSIALTCKTLHRLATTERLNRETLARITLLQQSYYSRACAQYAKTKTKLATSPEFVSRDSGWIDETSIWEKLTSFSVGLPLGSITHPPSSMEAMCNAANRFPEWENQHQQPLTQIKTVDTYKVRQALGNCLSVSKSFPLQEIMPEGFDAWLTSNNTKLNQITNLALSYLGLFFIPESIFPSLKNLEILYLNNNHLTGIPESISHLARLKTLNIQNNELLTLPHSISNLSELKQINLSNNPLLESPTLPQVKLIIENTHVHEQILWNDHMQPQSNSSKIQITIDTIATTITHVYAFTKRYISIVFSIQQ